MKVLQEQWQRMLWLLQPLVLLRWHWIWNCTDLWSRFQNWRLGKSCETFGDTFGGVDGAAIKSTAFALARDSPETAARDSPETVAPVLDSPENVTLRENTGLPPVAFGKIKLCPAWSYCWRRCNRFRCSWWCWSWRLKISRRRMIWLRWPAPRRYRPRINWILSSLLQFLVLWLWRINTFSVLALKITVSARNDWFTPKRKSVRKFTSALDILHLPLTSQVISRTSRRSNC